MIIAVDTIKDKAAIYNLSKEIEDANTQAAVVLEHVGLDQIQEMSRLDRFCPRIRSDLDLQPQSTKISSTRALF